MVLKWMEERGCLGNSGWMDGWNKKHDQQSSHRRRWREQRIVAEQNFFGMDAHCTVEKFSVKKKSIQCDNIIWV